MKTGFTTGSCAAAAAKAAAYMLLGGRKKEQITITTPKGVVFSTHLEDIDQSPDAVSCAVKKDAGDDPDITDGILIYARVSYADKEDGATAGERIIIDGGRGIGRVTKPGLDQSVGEAAINHVPRQMIRQEVESVCRLFDHQGSLKVLIYAPEGERLAAQTFNPRLGIRGGISILGTSGIVEPMSSQALLDTIKVELNQRRALGEKEVVLAPGNYGLDFMKETYGYDLDKAVKCSNFIGASVDMAVELGFRAILYTGHIGKLIKVAGGIMNTHSREADCRLEILTALAATEGAQAVVLSQIMEAATTQEAVRILKDAGLCDRVMDNAAQRISFYLEKRAGGKLRCDCILFAKQDDNNAGYCKLAESKGVKEWYTLLAQDAEPQT